MKGYIKGSQIRLLQVFSLFAVLQMQCVMTDEVQENAESQNSKSIYELAVEYQQGENMYLEKALDLLEKVANEPGQDQDKALFDLGLLYQYGDFVPRDFNLAMGYFNRSADLGNPNAMFELGFMWGTGKGVPINKPLALLYYTLASQSKNVYADMALGFKYSMGHDVAKSCNKAAYRFEHVAEKVSYLKQHQIWNNEIVRLSEMLELAKEKAKEEDIIQFYQFSADGGDPHAQVTLGTFFLQGIYGVDQDFQQAFHYFKLAADRGDLSGVSNLGFMYAQGLGTPQDNETALKYYKEAAEKGNPQAQTNLGYMYWHGYGVPKSSVDAHKWFKLAADQGYAEGQVNMGTLYYIGDGVKQDYAKAMQYFSLAAQQGNIVAIYNLAEMHHHGLGTSPSCPLAVQLYRRVAERGPWASILDEAHKLFVKGEYEGALLRYEKASQWGYEVAQANAGYMYDMDLGSALNGTNATRFNMAFEYYRSSAEQKNALSYLKIGDYYYYGLGTEKSFEKAAMYYQAASELRNAHATFNLGYMHQHGLGLPKDLYLAKRHYDHALAMEKEAWLAVYLILFTVGYEFFFEWFKTADLVSLFGVELDTLLIVILVSILVLLLLVRQIILARRPMQAVQM